MSTQEIGHRTHPFAPGSEEAQRGSVTGHPMPSYMTQRPTGWRLSGWKILGLAAVGLVIAGGIYLAPDIRRYMRMRNM